MIWYIILSIIVLWLFVIIFRALRFVPNKENDVEVINVNPDAKKAAENLSKMIACKTISNTDREKIDVAEFEKFKELIIKQYPKINEACERIELGYTGILYRWKGKNTGNETVLMSHYDVVPVNEELWSKAPFEGIIEDGTIWGRGTIDTKSTLCAIMEAAEYLINQGYVPENDIYFSFSGDEEVSGDSTPNIVEYLRSNGIKPAIVVDEGGAVVDDVFPGVSRTCAMVGLGEKGYLDLELSATGSGGHSSTPPPNTLIGILAKAAVRIEKKQFKAQLSEPVKELFNTLGRHSSLGLKIIFANLWCFMPLLDFLFKRKGGQLNALIRTTCAITKAQGSKSYNVLPPYASLGVNLRLMQPDTKESAISYIKKVINDDRISIKTVECTEPSPCSDTKSKEWNKLCNVIKQTWQGVLISPYLMLGATDSRHFCKICDNVYRFSPMKLTNEEIGLMHSNDERIKVETLMEAIAFYIRLMLQC